MKTVKEVSEITGVSIRTLRYYDEIGLLNPTQLTEVGYRLYDNKALEKLQQIMFFRELEIPLVDIKEIMENPDYDKEQILLTQKSLLESKRNRLNGIIELITDVRKGVNTMSFEAFNDNDIKKILDHLEENLSKEALDELVKKYGSIEEYRDLYAKSLKDEKVNAELIKWYGSKEKAVTASIENVQDVSQYQKENKAIYEQFFQLIGTDDIEAEKRLVTRLVECFKGMFHLDNARAMLLDLATEYLQNDKLREASDGIYGKGSAEYIAQAIQRYYGVE